MQNMRLSRAVVILILSPSLTKDRSIELQTALTLNRPPRILPIPGFSYLTSKIVQLANKAKNADISILSNFLAIFFDFSLYREILSDTIYMLNFRSIGPFNQKLQKGGGGGRICPPPAIPICKKPGLFRVNLFFQYKIQLDAFAGLETLQSA